MIPTQHKLWVLRKHNLTIASVSWDNSATHINSVMKTGQISKKIHQHQTIAMGIIEQFNIPIQVYGTESTPLNSYLKKSECICMWMLLFDFSVIVP